MASPTGQPNVQAAAGSGQQPMGPEVQDQVDQLVRRRLEQAFNSVFGKVLTATERAAQAAEAQVQANKLDGLTKGLKLDIWKPTSREEELRGWKDWFFQLRTWLASHDAKFEEDLGGLEDDVEQDHALLSDAAVHRSQKLFGVLCSYIRGRPLLLVKSQESTKNGLEAIRLLKREMEPRERARALAIVRNLASWTFREGNLHEQLVAFEEAVTSYERASGKQYSQDLMIATVVTGLREPLKSQVQLRMNDRTEYRDLREWVLSYESVNAPWAVSVPTSAGKGAAGGGHEPTPMEVDQIKGKGWDSRDGKNKGKNGKGGKNKGKDIKGAKGNKGKDKWSSSPSSSWQPGKGKGYAQSGWDQGGGWQQRGGGQPGQPKGKGQMPGYCHNCGGKGHWKKECPHPRKGGGKSVKQVEDQSSVPSSGQSVASTSASAYRTPSTVQVVQAIRSEVATAIGTPPGCRSTQIFDMTEVDSDFGDYALDEPHVMMISAAEVIPTTFALDSQDGDGVWTIVPGDLPVYNLEPSEPDAEEEPGVLASILQIGADVNVTEVVVDSGADVSVAPLAYQNVGQHAPASRVQMQDAQGHRIAERGSRILSLAVRILEQGIVTIREKFAIAAVNSVILSLGKLVRGGWTLAHTETGPAITKGGCTIPVGLRRNTLVIAATVAMVAALDSGALPPEGEEAVMNPGWHILPSGLPLLVGHRCLEVSLETSVWSAEDWAWIAIFVRKEEATRKPEPGDVWVQVWTGPTAAFPEAGKKITEMEEELAGHHDFAVLFHVDEIPENALTNPGHLFYEPAEDAEMEVPAEAGEDHGGGIGDVWADRPVRGQERDPKDEEAMLDDVALSMETPLRDLRELCRKLGLPSSGAKPKVLKRLRTQKEVIEKQLAAEVARDMYKEQERNPEVPKAPVLPTPQQQEAHFVTHQPFASWCPACVLARSRQSPHPRAKEAKAEKEGDKKLATIQIDYAYTFTGDRGVIEEEPADEDGAKQDNQGDEDEAKKDESDKANQFALNLVAGEAVTGWLVGMPVVAKGAAALKKVTENLVRTSILIGGSEDVVVQGDTEPAIGQILNAIQACRTRLGLRTVVRQVPRDSHQSNGVAEKAVSTLRRLALTLKAHAEERAKVKISGTHPVFAWLMKHAAFLHNRFFVGTKSTPPFEAVYGKRFRGKLIAFGEVCIGHVKSKFKGDLQWRKAVFVGINERTGAYVLLTDEGGFETRSLRRLPLEEQWSAEALVNAKGLPWDLGGKVKRKRALYTSRPALLPDTATLEELARAAGHAAAASIAAGTPRPPVSEAGSDSPERSSTSSSTSSSGDSQQQQQQGGGAERKAEATSRPAAEPERKGKATGRPAAEPERKGKATGRPAAEPERKAEATGRPAAEPERGTSSGASAGIEPQTEGPQAMEISKSSRGADEGDHEATVPKRARLLLDKPGPSSPTTASALYPPSFAGIREVHNDVEAQDLVDGEEWSPELFEAMSWEAENEAEDGDKPPEVSPEELAEIDFESDRVEVERLIEMGVLRRPKPGEALDGHSKLTTKMVRDWRRRPNWVRRSRLVGREYRSWEPWRAELFAPSSSLAVVHSVMAWALARGLEVCTLDVKDAYLNCEQKQPVVVEVDSRLMGGNEGMMTFILERLLPGQRIAASEWFQFMTDLLGQAGLESFGKEPTLFRAKDQDECALVLHADDGILAATNATRKKIIKKLGERVVVQVSDPLAEVGESVEFLKRKYLLEDQGIVMFSGDKHLDGLVKALGENVRARDTPVDQTVLEPDTSAVLSEPNAKMFRECVGRLLYLSHTRPDVQFGTCALTSKMSSPTATAMRHLTRVVGYLKKYPTIGFLIKAINNKSCVDYGGEGPLEKGDTIYIESVTDADWAGCKGSRKSRSSVQLFVGGSLVGSYVRSQKTVALSSGESEFLAMISGACELVYLRECLDFVTKGDYNIKAVARSDSAAARGIGSRVGCGRVRHLHCGFLWIQEAVRKGEVTLRPIGGQRNPADIGTKPLAGRKLRELLFRCGAIGPDGERFGSEEHQEAEQKLALRRLATSGATAGGNAKKILPVLLVLAQVLGAESYEGLGVAMVTAMMEDAVFSLTSTAATALVLASLVVGMVWMFSGCIKMLFSRRRGATPKTADVGVQARFGPTKSEERFMQEYVTRATELREALHDEHKTVTQCEDELRILRKRNRTLEAEAQERDDEIRRLQARPQWPDRVAVATQRGRVFHVPGCSFLRNSGAVREFTPCQYCFRG